MTLRSDIEILMNGIDSMATQFANFEEVCRRIRGQVDQIAEMVRMKVWMSVRCNLMHREVQICVVSIRTLSCSSWSFGVFIEKLGLPATVRAHF